MRTDEFLRPLPTPSGRPVYYFDVTAALAAFGMGKRRPPRCVRVLAEALARSLSRLPGAEAALRALAGAGPAAEIPFLPARVLLQDFTGVPCVADLAALRGAVQRLGGDPATVEPRIPVDLVIDHSVQLDASGSPDALARNVAREFERNRERYAFLRWGRRAFSRLRVLPPGLGICHQVNMEYLAEVVRLERGARSQDIAVPDTVVGTDSHTTMINSLGVLGWGVGGIEAEAAMLGHPIPLAMPRVVGVRLTGCLPPGATATDAALTLTQTLREHGVVERFVEFFGPGLAAMSAEDRAPLANMAPEYGATTGFFPIDSRTLEYLRLTGRPADRIELVEAFARAQGLWHEPAEAPCDYDDVIAFDLSAVAPSVAGPQRPHDRIPLADVGRHFDAALAASPRRAEIAAAAPGSPVTTGPMAGLADGAVILASITSCTNTSNPSLLVAAGLIARNARRAGLRPPAWVKTSFAPGSRAAAAFLRRAGLLEELESLGFHIAAYGCATCIGNSGPVPPGIESETKRRGLIVAAVLSGNRNFEGRVHPLARANYLCSPPLVVAYALRGTVRGDLTRDPLGLDAQGRPVFLADIWPPAEEIARIVRDAVHPDDFRDAYADPESLTPNWGALDAPAGSVFEWHPASTYIREPPFLADVGPDVPPAAAADLRNAAILGLFGDFITTDHISPAGSIAAESPAARYLVERGVAPADFNSYGARRGNHEVMVRGTFGNIRLRNRMVGREGNLTINVLTGEEMSFFDAAEAYRQAGVPLVVIAGRMYGAGSSRDWAAKGPALLGVRAVLAVSFERIHRSNLVEMGVLPLVFPEGVTADTLGLTGRERLDIVGLDRLAPMAAVRVLARRPDSASVAFEATARIDNEQELDYYRHGGILPYVLRRHLTGAD